MLITFGIVLGSASIGIMALDAVLNMSRKERERRMLRETNIKLVNENTALKTRTELLEARLKTRQHTRDMIKDTQIDDLKHEIRCLEARLAAKDQLEMPAILMEPGRSIVADAGMTLYTAGTVKEITGYKNYVSVDGGMTDNPRFALYGSAYTVHLANRMDEACDFEADVVGRCCESGDIIQPAVTMPEPNRGDIVAVCTTGAYNYSMASNYNRIPRPPVVMLRDGQDYVAVKRESFEDLTANDI